MGFKEKQIVTIGLLEYMKWDWLNTVHRLACYYDSIGREDNFSSKGVTEELNDMTIFSYSCSGGILYRSLGLQFKSPFINMRVPEKDFLRFLHFPREYIQAPLKLVDAAQDAENNYYPIFSLYDIKVHMIHYHDFQQAAEKWEERKQRINWGNVFVMMGTDLWYIADEFDRLPYKHKACIVPFATKLKSCITVDKLEEDDIYSMVLEIARGKYPRYYQALLQKMCE